MDPVIDAQKAVAQTIYNNVVRVHGKDCAAEYFSAGTVAEPSVRVVEADGSLSVRIGGGGRDDGMASTAEHHGGAGRPPAWFSATLRVTDDGRFTFDFDYDNLPAWHIPPCDETYIADLEKFRRPADQIPTWRHPGHPSTAR